MSTPMTPISQGRSPHGERGLKYASVWFAASAPEVALLTESVD